MLILRDSGCFFWFPLNFCVGNWRVTSQNWSPRMPAVSEKAHYVVFWLVCLDFSYREEAHEQADEEEGEDLVSKAEAEFFKIIDAEKKALEEAENKRNAAFSEVKQAIAQEGITHEEYQEGASEEKQSDEVRKLSCLPM